MVNSQIDTNMSSLEISSLGPINKGEVDISPLTVLIGPNSCGKSYTARTLYSLFDCASVRHPIETFLSIEADDSSSFRDKHKTLTHQCRLEEWLAEETLIRLASQWKEGIENAFSVELSKISSGEKQECKVSANMDIGRVDLTIGHGDEKVGVNVSGIEPNLLSESQIGIDFVIDFEDELHLAEGGEHDVSKQLDTVFEESLQSVSMEDGSIEKLDVNRIIPDYDPLQETDLSKDTHYLPANRAGFLETHNVLAAGAFKQLSDVGIKELQIPAFAGVSADYLQGISSLTDLEEGELADLSRYLEQEALNGRVKATSQDQRPQPVITFEQDGIELPFHLVSTGISELSPIVLFTRYMLTEDSMLIIEEPESHLHPENQRKIAEFIAQLVNRGVYVFLTTHSDFLLEQLNNHIRLSAIDKPLREEEEIDKTPVSPDNVSAHVFEESEEADLRYDIHQLEVTAESAISMDEFERVIDELYGESHKVNRLLNKQKNGESN